MSCLSAWSCLGVCRRQTPPLLSRQGTAVFRKNARKEAPKIGANFEIEIASRNYIPLHGFDGIWNVIGSSVRFDEFMISPNCFFDHMIPFAEADMTPEKAERVLREGKRLYQSGRVDGTIRIGVIQWREDSWGYRSSLWFDTQRLPQYGLERMNEEAECLRAAVDRCMEKQDMLFYAMGVEMSVGEACDRTQMVGESSGVLVWRFYDE